jgi:hypothetical protein
MQKQILGRDPAFILAAVQAGLAMLLSFGWLKFIGLDSQEDLAILVGVLAALSAAYLSWGTSETMLAAVIELFKGLVGLGAIYGLSITTEQTGLVIAFITALFTGYLRTQTSPLEVGSFKTINPGDTHTLPKNEVGAAEFTVAAVVLLIIGAVLWIVGYATLGIIALVVAVVLLLVPLVRR